MIVKTVSGAASSTFYQTIPETFTFYGGSFSHYSYYSDNSYLYIDGVAVSTFGQNSGYVLRNKDAPSIVKGTPQTIRVTHNGYSYNDGSGNAGVAVVLIYSPP